MAVGVFRRFRAQSSFHRLVLVALVAILLPIAALIAVQYRSLLDLQRNTAVAVHENLREAARGVAARLRADLDQLAREALLPAGRLFFDGGDAAHFEQQCAAARRAHPEIAQLVLYANPAGIPGVRRYAYLYTRTGLREITDPTTLQTDHEARLALASFASAQAVLTTDPTSDGFLFWHRACAACRDDGSDLPRDSLYVFYV